MSKKNNKDAYDLYDILSFKLERLGALLNVTYDANISGGTMSEKDRTVLLDMAVQLHEKVKKDARKLFEAIHKGEQSENTS